MWNVCVKLDVFFYWHIFIWVVWIKIFCNVKFYLKIAVYDLGWVSILEQF